MLSEANIDTLVGPTHFYGGLAYGNKASMLNQSGKSNPKKAALQGLEKMKLLFEHGVSQLIFPPQPRPCIPIFKHLGFSGSEQQILDDCYKNAPELFVRLMSSSSMWTANSATVTSSQDSQDGKVHITPANLGSNLHRQIEVSFTHKLLHATFSSSRFVIHDPLPAAYECFDEGAANYSRLSVPHVKKALHFFVWGRSLSSTKEPKKYPARQTKEAQEVCVRLHQIDPESVLFAQQNPAVIDKGVFHNDVIATAHEQLLLVHEKAYVGTKEVLNALQDKAMCLFNQPLCIVVIGSDALSVEQAVASYLFNSQIVTTADGSRLMIAPTEVRTHPAAHAVCQSLIASKEVPIDKVLYIPLNQSMKNGGGPACLRLRIPLTEQELACVHPGAKFSLERYFLLKQCIERYYPESFSLKDILDPLFRKHIQKGYLAIASALNLPHIYEA